MNKISKLDFMKMSSINTIRKMVKSSESTNSMTFLIQKVIGRNLLTVIITQISNKMKIKT